MSGTIGTDKSGYANLRNITGLPFERYTVRRAPNLYRYPNYLYFRLTSRAHPYFDNVYRDWGSACDVLHFFNSLSLSKTPWITTFETYLPRWAVYGAGRVEKGLRLQVKPACRRLLALSECTRRIQEEFLSDWPAYREAIMAKVEVLHPPQSPLLGEIGEKGSLSEELHFVLVGADFYRKGGLEVLRVMERLRKVGKRMQLTIVSRMNAGDYASQAGASEVQEAEKIIGNGASWITHHVQLPNEKVLSLLKEADVALLPTWADTYGYFVLEAQAAGCPVITTNIRALPEINPPVAGWTIEVPLDSWGNGILATATDRKTFQLKLEEQLEAVLEDILAAPELVRDKGKRALERIQGEHDPKRNARRLEQLYDHIRGI